MVQCLEEGMSRVARVTPEHFGFATDVFKPGGGDFALSVTQVSQAEPAGTPLPASRERILMCTAGEIALVNERNESLWLERGDVAFAGPADGRLTAVGTGEIAQAYQPTDAMGGKLTDLV